MKEIKISKEEYFSRQVLRDDIIVIGDLYSDEGYANADVVPNIDQDSEKLLVNITYTITKGSLVYFEGIRISGNTKTRDKVIRRELDIYEQELFSGKKLKRGIRNLNRLDYFEDIKVNTAKGSEPDKMLLEIDVKEKPTGTFSFGGGYSSVENMFVVGSVAQRNLFGRGQLLRLKAELGGRTTRYDLSFTEPWLFDIPLSAGFDLYNQYRDYDSYNLTSVGGAVRFGYPVYDFTRAYITYGYDISDLTELSDTASSYFKQMAGKHTTSSITPSIRYDSRDKVFNPTEGSNQWPIGSIRRRLSGRGCRLYQNIREKSADIFRCSGARWDFCMPRPVMSNSTKARCCRHMKGFILAASIQSAGFPGINLARAMKMAMHTAATNSFSSTLNIFSR